MAKIQCPHCKAVNQDVTLNDPCWQCGTILGAPVSAIETGVGPPTSEVNPANKTGSSNPMVQSQIERNRPRDRDEMPPSQRPRTSSFNVGVVVVVGVIIAFLVMLLVVYLKMKH